MAGTDFDSMHSLLNVAMYNDDTTTVKELLAHGFDVNSTNANTKETPLMTASFLGKSPNFGQFFSKKGLKILKTRESCKIVAFYLSNAANRTQKFQT